MATYAARCVENEILMHFRAMRKCAQDISLSEPIESGSDGAVLELMEVIAEEGDLVVSAEQEREVAEQHLASCHGRKLGDGQDILACLAVTVKADEGIAARGCGKQIGRAHV